MIPKPPGPDPARPDDDLPLVERTSVLVDAVDDAARLRREHAFERLSALSVPPLAPLVRVAAVDGGVALVHLVPAGAVPLSALRSSGPLRSGHVLAVGVAVAEAVVALDRAALAHGAVDLDHVLVGPDGSLVLGSTGAAWATAPGEPDGPSASDDVEALGLLVRDLLGAGSSPSSLVLAALRAADPDPALRPSPTELLGLLRRCGRAEPLLDLLWQPEGRSDDPPPLRLDPRAAPRSDEPSAGSTAPTAEQPPGGAAPGASRQALPRRTAPPRPGSRDRSSGGPRGGSRTGARGPRPGRSLLLLLLVSGLALVSFAAVRVGASAMAEVRPATSAGPMPSSETATATTTPDVTGAAAPSGAAQLDPDRGSPAPTDWRSVLAAIDTGRRAALAAGDTPGLGRWVEPDGPAWRSDAALAQRVRSLGARVEGGGLVLLDVRPVRVTDGEATLLVQDRREPYSVVTRAGRSEVTARPARWWRVTLRASSDQGAGWRVRDVAAAPPPA